MTSTGLTQKSVIGFGPATRRRGFLLRAALLVMTVLITTGLCAGQAENLPPVASKPTTTKTLPADERAELLKIIRTLEERVGKLEAAQVANSAPPAAAVTAPTPEPSTPVQPVVETPTPVVPEKSQDDDDEDDDNGRSYGRYTPNFGFKVVNTEYGDLNVSVYTYARYLNQLGLNANYQDAFGNTKNVQERQDFQLQKVQIKLLGWIFDPKFRYFIYTWTSNRNSGAGRAGRSSRKPELHI